ncbi:MAG: antibiotic biosynthesis monooxygenase [Saprospiraceae bacterium]|nr:antibiotic biosynthesis monooxygenase [Saprospiraceae bacterium]HRG68552.1 antibiotic biosynthesis monooxygenase [Saprospiraceae bacterium]
MNSFKPYYAVIFSSHLSEDTEGYESMSFKMLELVKKQKGYLGHESARDGIGITVSYWDSLEAIKNWKENEEHLLAQSEGRKRWYQSYRLRICKVEREYGVGL